MARRLNTALQLCFVLMSMKRMKQKCTIYKLGYTNCNKKKTSFGIFLNFNKNQVYFMRN